MNFNETENREGRGFLWQFLVLGILEILMALLAFRDPTASLGVLVTYYGIMAILLGIFTLLLTGPLNRIFGIGKVWPILSGAISIIFGLLILFNILASILALPYLFAFWFIVDSVVDLYSIYRIHKIYPGPWPGALKGFSIISEVLTLLLGILMFIHPGSGLFTIVFMVGLFFMMRGIFHLVHAFV